MKFLLVVLFLLDGQWVEGDASKGWGAMAYDTEAACLASEARATTIYENQKLTNPRLTEKRFECIAEQSGAND